MSFALETVKLTGLCCFLISQVKFASIPVLGLVQQNPRAHVESEMFLSFNRQTNRTRRVGPVEQEQHTLQ